MGKRSFGIPINIRKIIENVNTTKLQKNRMYKIVHLVLDDFSKEKLMFDEYRDYPSSYWKKAIAEHYENALLPLVLNGVIDRPNSYCNIAYPQCKKMRINSEILMGEEVVVKYVYDESEKRKRLDRLSAKTKKILKELKCDRDAALTFIEEYIESSDFEGKLRFDDEIMEGDSLKVVYKPYGKKKREWYASKELILNYARQRKKVVVQDDRKIKIVESKERYFKNKKRSVKYSYDRQINKFLCKDFYANRNKVNKRLDSNVTTLPNVLMKFLTLDGERLVGLDLKNAQFLFLGILIEQGVFDKYIELAKNNIDVKNRKLMQENSRKKRISIYSSYRKVINGEGLMELIDEEGKVLGSSRSTYMCAGEGLKVVSRTNVTPLITKDIVLFLLLVKNGEFYEFIQRELGLGAGEKGRARAKKMMFEIFFSKYDFNSTSKKRVKELFPVLVEMIDLFKKDKREEQERAYVKKGLTESEIKLEKKGDNQFAITLQKAESGVFIDDMLSKLFGAGFKVLSKHDSILCKESDSEAVEAIMRDRLDAVFGEGCYELKREE